ncbi:hypothetical protein [Paenibacillus sp. N3.4]|nr:hypothetical protein [Paenibacillus sp. N3.4]
MQSSLFATITLFFRVTAVSRSRSAPATRKTVLTDRKVAHKVT